MRIAFLAWHGSVHTRRWVRWFAERGHDVHVVTCGGGDVRDVDRAGMTLPQPWQVHELGAPRAGKLGYLGRMRAARRAIRAIDPDVVHAHWLTSYGLLALAAGRRPLVVTAHGDDLLIAPASRPMRALVRRVLRAADVVTVPSDRMRDCALALLDPEDDRRVEVFQYGVECGRLAARGRELRQARAGATAPAAAAPLHVVSARALLRLYRVDVLLDALALLRGRGVAVRCDIAGDGPERAALEQQSRDLGLDDVVAFRGHMAPHEVEDLVGACDAYVTVSESDGTSLALLEALALGALPVASDIPANRPWVREGSGVLVPIVPAAVAEAIARIASLDRERAAADNAALVAERADRDTNLAACEQLLDGLCGVTFQPVRRAA